MHRLAVLALLLLPGSIVAQALPAHVPSNPILASRSALYVQPIVPPHTGWQVSAIVDYGNVIERTASTDGRGYLFDAETLQLDLWMTRDLAPNAFAFVNLPIRGGYDGFLDGFLNWYHDLIGLPVPARNDRPEDAFEWAFELPGTEVDRPRPGSFVGDVRLGAGVRIGRGQLVGAITLPTTTTDLEGWGRGTLGTSLAWTTALHRGSRLALDGGVAVGWTPTHGQLAAFQRSAFVGGMIGLRWRVLGPQVLFGTVWTQTANWKDTGFAALETTEVTIDFGGLLRLKEGWPRLQLGMTEDLVPRGPAVDVGFKVGLHWGPPGDGP